MAEKLVKSWATAFDLDLSGTGLSAGRAINASYRAGHSASDTKTDGDFAVARQGFVYRWTPTALDQLIRFWDFDDADGMKFAEYTVTAGYASGTSGRLRGLDGGVFPWASVQVVDIRKVLLDDGEFFGSFVQAAAGSGTFATAFEDQPVTVTMTDLLTTSGGGAVAMPLGYSLTKIDPAYAVTASTDLMLSIPNSGSAPFGWAVDITIIGARA